MYRLIVCLAVVATLSLVTETASAGHGRRVVRAHHGIHHHHGHHAVYRAPIVRHHGYHHAVVRHHAYHAPYAYPVYGQVAYPSYGGYVGQNYGYAPSRVYYGGHGVSVHIGF
jgi:hypothetical protein